MTTEPSNKTSRLTQFGLPLIVLVSGIAGFLLLNNLRGEPESSAPTKLAPLVRTVQIRSYEDGLIFQTDGQVVPYREVSLAAEVAGRVQKKWPDCETGRFVLKGSPLIQIDPRDYELEAQRLTELARQADLNLDELVIERSNTDQLIELAEEELELRRKELRREQTLVEKKAGSEKELDAVRRAELVTRNALRKLLKERSLLDVSENRLNSEKKRLQAELEKAQLNVRRTRIVAPVDGMVMKDAVEEDGYVTPGTMLALLEDVSKVEVRFNLQMDELQWFWRHANVTRPTAKVESGGSYRLPNLPLTISYQVEGQTFDWQGTLSRYDGAGINAATRTVPCIAQVDDPRQARLVGESRPLQRAAPPALMRGMFVRVRLHVPLKESLLTMPEAAIRPGNKLWVVRDGKLHIEPAGVIQIYEGQALLMPAGENLSPGTEVVVSPLPFVVDGMEVRLPQPQPRMVDSESSGREGAGG
jgi:multidrug efflux pump subunit AcrA (membrane-fusion protein)